jgi:streptomycin 3"-adenylyltransferase
MLAANSNSRALAHHSETRPTTGDLELSIITTYNAKSKPNPMPYELHYSHEWYEKVMGDEVEYSSNKTDLDINSHLAYVTTRGVKLFGKPINEAFGKPDWNSFQAAIIDDFNWIIDNEHILESPFYCTLNICRVLRYTQEPHHAFSKDEGGEWGLKHLPKNYHKLIQESLDVYHSPEVVDEKARRTGGKKWNEEELLAFRDFAREQSI